MCSSITYRIVVKGQIGTAWSDWFDGLQVRPQPDGTTQLAGPLTDQAALHGVLAKIRDLNLTLISVELQSGRERIA